MNRYDLIIRGGCVVDTEGRYPVDLAVDGGKVVRMDEHIPDTTEAVTEMDARGLYIVPGLIDTHVHLNEPGRTEWEGFATGTRSLAAGGVTTFFDMPLNAHPPTTTVEGFVLKQQAARSQSIIDYRFWGGLVPGNIEQLKPLQACGVIGFKAFMSGSGIDDFERVDEATLFRGMQEIASMQSILALHAESDTITGLLTDQKLAAGRVSVRDYCETRPVESEMEAVYRAIRYAEMTGCRLHIVHASSARVVGLVTDAKRRGVDVTVETCPHYLSLTVEDFERLGPVAKCAPPLREREEVDELWRAVAKGEVDLIGSDHSPSPAWMKQDDSGNVFKAWGGISGAQSTLNVLLEEGYHHGRISLESIVKLTSTAPAKRFGLFPQKGVIAVGSDADLTLIDLNDSFRLEASELFYRHPHSPYLGRKFRGRVVTTLSQGRVVYHRGAFPNAEQANHGSD